MIDTDFASDILSYDSEEDLSADTLSRWERAKIAKMAFYVEHLKWQSVDVSQCHSTSASTHLNKQCCLPPLVVFAQYAEERGARA